MKTTVYVVYHSEGMAPIIDGVFTNINAAKKYIQSQTTKWHYHCKTKQLSE